MNVNKKFIEMIDWTMDKYKEAVNTQKMNQQVIKNIIEELDKKREVVINKKQKAILKDEVLEYGEEEDTIDYILFMIRELTGKVY
jgi:protein tyrosine phosphatase